ncbi:MAG: GntR family transcriptional regulator [Lentisphaeria bacterium]|nr:GntR family transcriptional regulator [Lentisphaeria bacterium]
MKRKPGHIAGEISVAGYVRIRKHVIDTIIHGDRKPQRLASMRELAVEFGVGCTTVQKALKDLVADGLLTAKVGVGMFTNPQRGWREERPQVVELLSADGKQIYFENYLCRMSGAAAAAITGAGYFLHHVDLFQSNRGAAADLGGQSCGLIWVAPEMTAAERADEFFRSLAVPRAVVAGVVAGFDSVDYDLEREGYEVVSELLEEGRRRLLVLANLSHPNRQFAGIRRAFRERGLPFDDGMVLDHHRDILEQFRAFFECNGMPEAIYDIGGGPVRLWSEFRARRDDFVSRCRLVMADDRPAVVPCRMLRHDYDMLAAAGMRLLQRRLAVPESEPVTELYLRERYCYIPE